MSDRADRLKALVDAIRDCVPLKPELDVTAHGNVTVPFGLNVNKLLDRLEAIFAPAEAPKTVSRKIAAMSREAEPKPGAYDWTQWEAEGREMREGDWSCRNGQFACIGHIGPELVSFPRGVVIAPNALHQKAIRANAPAAEPCCQTCGIILNQLDKRHTLDCGGDCLGCVRVAEGRDRLDGEYPGDPSPTAEEIELVRLAADCPCAVCEMLRQEAAQQS